MGKLTAGELEKLFVDMCLSSLLGVEEDNPPITTLKNHIASIETELTSYKAHRTEADEALSNWITFGQAGATFGESQLLNQLRGQEERAERAEARLAEATKLLQEVEWKGAASATCPICLGEKYEGDFGKAYQPHQEGCELAAFLKDAQ